MGKKAKLKKIRKQQQNSDQIEGNFDSTQFVKQFKKMGYRLPAKNKVEPKTDDIINIAPEIPQEKIEPQL